MNEDTQSGGELVRLGGSTALLGAVFAALGAFVFYQAMFGPAASTYARIGPGFFPAVVGAATVIAGLALVAQALRGRWSMHLVDDTVPEGGAVSGGLAAGWRMLLVVLGLIANLLLITPFGFIVASTVMFTLTTRAFGSRNLLANAAIGLAFTGTIYVAFRYGLNLRLPAGTVWG